mmetsp:Transcript_6955/g.17453  ORF Transcript_6955/g.17453 Transcript_6955/m.17453 type:complete len:359 (+) Transcript_6955:326-1402(+)
MARKERHVSFPAGIVLGVVRQNHVDLLEERGYHGVLRKCFAVREVIRKSFRDQQFQGGLVHGVSGASRVKNVVHVPHVSKPTSQQKWCLFGFVPFWQIDTSICCCLDFFAFQVVSKILNEEEQIVSPYVKPIVFFIVVIVNITPHRSHLLPNIVIFFGTFVGNIDCSDGRIGLGGTNHEPVTFGSPGFSNGRDLEMARFDRVDQAEDLVSLLSALLHFFVVLGFHDDSLVHHSIIVVSLAASLLQIRIVHLGGILPECGLVVDVSRQTLCVQRGHVGMLRVSVRHVHKGYIDRSWLLHDFQVGRTQGLRGLLSAIIGSGSTCVLLVIALCHRTIVCLFLCHLFVLNLGNFVAIFVFLL